MPVRGPRLFICRASNLVLHERPHASIGLPVVELLPAPGPVLERPSRPRAQTTVPRRIPISVKVELQPGF